MVFKSDLSLNIHTAMKMPYRYNSFQAIFILIASLCAFVSKVRCDALPDEFLNPPNKYGAYVWWHWMGQNVTKEGITKDLEAMKASHIGGATIFNLTSSVQEGAKPTLNLPFPELNYRGERWWDMLLHAVKEAERLGLELGMHNCVGYSATGGPWITPELSMQSIIFKGKALTGPFAFSGLLEKPKSDYFKDIVIIAVPDVNPISTDKIIDVTHLLDNDGRLNWQVPEGKWIVYRFSHISTGRSPHPMPEGVSALEVDKLSASASIFHFNQVIEPLKEKLGTSFGKTFKHLTLDSYEAGDQSWTPGFREEFIKRKGYDPFYWLSTLDAVSTWEGKIQIITPKRSVTSLEHSKRFRWDYNDVIASLYQESNFEQGARLMKESGLELHFEPYRGKFDTIAAASVADVPMGEFWTNGKGGCGENIVAPARAKNRKIVACEAFTGLPKDSKFSEDPAFLKIPGDGGFADGVNRLVLHHWVHQPFDDSLKPGMGMGWWGTHFGRNQTWAEPGKEYFKYLARTQYILQQGQGIGDYLTLDFAAEYADAIPRSSLLKGEVSVRDGRFYLPSGRNYPFLVLPDTNQMLPEVAQALEKLVDSGGVILGRKPMQSPTLKGYPESDQELKRISTKLWGLENDFSGTTIAIGKGKVFAGSVEQYAQHIKYSPPFQIPEKYKNSIRGAARLDGETQIYFISNSSTNLLTVPVDFRVSGMIPEIWNAEDGSHGAAAVWEDNGVRTTVPLKLNGKQSLLILFRKPATKQDHVVSIATEEPNRSNQAGWFWKTNHNGESFLLSDAALNFEITYSSGKQVKTKTTPPKQELLGGAWSVGFTSVDKTEYTTTFSDLKSWSEHSDPFIKYYAGTAYYRKKINVASHLLNDQFRIYLDLGLLSNLASVKINGSELGVLWYAPFLVDATDFLKPGENVLEVAITNTWANRLIGDEQEPDDCEWGPPRTFGGEVIGRPLLAYPNWIAEKLPRPAAGRKAFFTWNYFSKDSPLLPAGLFGPVTLKIYQQIRL